MLGVTYSLLLEAEGFTNPLHVTVCTLPIYYERVPNQKNMIQNRWIISFSHLFA